MEAELKWEKIKSNDALTWWRAEVPGGWLLQPNAPDLQLGPPASYSATFVPDPEHAWGKPDAA